MWKKSSCQKRVSYSSKEDQSQQQEWEEIKKCICGLSRQWSKFIVRWRTKKHDINGFTPFDDDENEVRDIESSYDELHNVS